jgi:hypothetical protein
MNSKLPLIIATALALGACAENFRWEHPGLTTAQWSSDKSSCKDAAVLKVNTDIAVGRGFSARDADFRNDQYTYQMDRYEGLRRQDKLTDACLIKKGYRKVNVVIKKK